MPISDAKPVIWIVDSEHWPRAYLRAELIERGYEGVSFSALSPALTELKWTARFPDAVVLELRGQEITSEALDALARSNVPVVAIGGAVEINDPGIAEFSWAELLRRPVSIGAVADAVERILSQRKKT